MANMQFDEITQRLLGTARQREALRATTYTTETSPKPDGDGKLAALHGDVH